MAQSGGQPGNTNASKSKPFWHAIDRAIAQDDGKKLRKAADALLNAAASGEDWAIKELGDRLDGKPHQSIDATIDGTLTVELVKFTDAGKDTG